MFGTASIAANAVANNFASMEVIPAAAIGLGLVTVVGQCVGAGKIEEARYHTEEADEMGVYGFDRFERLHSAGSERLAEAVQSVAGNAGYRI